MIAATVCFKPQFSERGEVILRLPKNVADGLYRRGTEPLARCLARYRWLTPDRVSFAGFLAGGVAAPLCILTQPLWVAGVLFALGDFLDYLDGDLARSQGRASREGAIFDATLDRYTDFFAIGALTYLTAVILDRYPDLLIRDFSFLTSEAALVLGLAALLGATLTPYVRAKTEAEGKKSPATIGSRGVRNFILVFGLLASQPVWTLVAIAVVANLGAIHRLGHAWRRE